MRLTPHTVTQDSVFGNKKLNCGPQSKPCGKVCIPKDNQCRASWNKPVKAATGAAALVGAGVVGTALFHPRERVRTSAQKLIDPVLQGGFAINNIARGDLPAAANNIAHAALLGGDIGKNVRSLAAGYGTDIKAGYNKAKEAYFKFRHHRQAKKDSIWANGFEP